MLDAFNDYLHIKDGKKHYLIDWQTDKMTAIEGEDDCLKHLSPIGSGNFVNINTHQLLINSKDNWSVLPDYFVIAPIITFPYPRYIHKNIVNIIKGTNGLGAINHKGEILIKPEHGEIAYELNITATKDGNKVEAIIFLGKCDMSDTLTYRHEEQIDDLLW